MGYDVKINGVSFLVNIIDFDLEEKMSEMGFFTLTLGDIEESNTDVVAGKIIEVFVNDTDRVFKGRLETVEFKHNKKVEITGFDMSIMLLQLTHNQRFTTTAPNSITSTVVGTISNPDGQSMVVGTNTVTTPSITFGIEDEEKLVGLARMTRVLGTDWFVDQDGGDDTINRFNHVPVFESVSSVASFDEATARLTSEQDREMIINSVIVLGKGDGDNVSNPQVRATATDAASITTHGTRERKFTDKTLKTTTEAQEMADAIIALRKDPVQRVMCNPYDPEQDVGVGDKITVTSANSGLAAQVVRIIVRRIKLTRNSRLMEFECVNKRIGMTDENRKNTELTESHQSYQSLEDPTHSHTVTATTATSSDTGETINQTIAMIPPLRGSPIKSSAVTFDSTIATNTTFSTSSVSVSGMGVTVANLNDEWGVLLRMDNLSDSPIITHWRFSTGAADILMESINDTGMLTTPFVEEKRIERQFDRKGIILTSSTLFFVFYNASGVSKRFKGEFEVYMYPKMKNLVSSVSVNATIPSSPTGIFSGASISATLFNGTGSTQSHNFTIKNLTKVITIDSGTISSLANNTQATRQATILSASHDVGDVIEFEITSISSSVAGTGEDNTFNGYTSINIESNSTHDHSVSGQTGVSNSTDMTG